MINRQEGSKAHFVEYLRSIFGNDEQIGSLGDLRRMLEEQLRTSYADSRPDVDRYYDEVAGVKKRKLQIPTLGKSAAEEETKGLAIRSPISYLEKCKKIGKLGPLVCRMDVKDSYGSWLVKDEEGLDVECKTAFGSTRANTCVFSGAWYYEVRLQSAGIIQLGWATLQTQFTPNDGVGDSPDSFAYDGCRVMKWNGGRTPYGEAWEIGDTIGCYIDFNKKEISFSRNGRSLGVAFTGIPTGENIAYFPAASMENGQRAVFNFGRRCALTREKEFRSMNECGESRGIHGFLTGTLLDALKRVLTENKGNGVEITEGDRRLVACLLWEFIFPAMSHRFIIDKTIIPFLLELSAFQDMNYFDFAVSSMLSYCTDEELRRWAGDVFRIIAENNLGYSYIDDDRRRDRPRQLPLALRLARYPRILAAWTQSASFYTDLEYAYFTHLPSRSDLQYMFPYVYYPGTIFQSSSKSLFNKNMSTQCTKCSQNQETLFELTRLLLSPASVPVSGKPLVIPRLAMMGFLDWLARKNVGYTQDFVAAAGGRSELTFPSTLTNVVFSLLAYLEPTVLVSPVRMFPFSTLYRADEALEFVKLDRMGGILTHLLTQYETARSGKFKALFDPQTTKPEETFLFALLNKVVVLVNYAVLDELNAGLRGFDKFIQISRDVDEQLEDQKSKNRAAREDEIKSAFLMSTPYQHYAFTAANIRIMHRLGCYLLDLCNHIDSECPELFYFVPEYYITSVSTIVKAFLRMEPQSLEFIWTAKCSPMICPRDALLDRFVTFVTHHLSDKKVPNPDQQEAFLTKLGILLQYRSVVPRLETHPVSGPHLVPAFLRAFDEQNVYALAKIFLRLFRKGLYNDITYTFLPDFGSEHFRRQFAELCTKDTKVRDGFLNAFLEHINNTLTELKLHYSESSNISLTSQERDEHKRASRTSYNILYDMLRVTETTVSLIPTLFLEQNGIFAQRVSDLCMLVVREGIQGQVSRFLCDLSTGEYRKFETIQMFLSPVAGVYLTLREAREKGAGRAGLVPLEEFVIKADGFELKLMRSFVEVLRIEGKEDPQLSALAGVVASLDGYIAKNCSPDKVKAISDEQMCTICYQNRMDTMIVPCEHMICEKCIMMQMLTNKKCPFCNVEIEKTIKKKLAQ